MPAKFSNIWKIHRARSHYVCEKTILELRRFVKQIQNDHKIKSIAKYTHNVIEVRGGRIRCRRHYDDGFSPLFSPLRARFSDLFKLCTRYVLRNDRDLVILI